MPSVYDVIRPVQERTRRRRMDQFARTFPLGPQTRILDVGGTPWNWTMIAARPHVTLLNLGPNPHGALPANMRYVEGDARTLDFAPGEFDLVYSNSVIEHVGTFADQQAFADGIRRIGAPYYVQTPNRRFPVEPHFIGLGTHWAPPSWRPFLARWTTVWGLMNCRDAETARAATAEIRLLDERELATLFPDASIEAERVAGLPKSLIALRHS